MGKRIILVGQSASGKDFIKTEFVKKGYKESISYTTRPPRPGEVNGINYYYISEAEFVKKIKEDFWYEYDKFNGWFYGSSKNDMLLCDIFIKTPRGISNLKPEDRVNSLIIYIDTPEDIRIKRLTERLMSGDSLERRLLADHEDFENFSDYDLKIQCLEK